MRSVKPGPGRIAGYEDLIEDAALELERVNTRLARGVAEQRMMQMRVEQLRAEAAAQEEGCCQAGQFPLSVHCSLDCRSHSVGTGMVPCSGLGSVFIGEDCGGERVISVSKRCCK